MACRGASPRRDEGTRKGAGEGKKRRNASAGNSQIGEKGYITGDVRNAARLTDVPRRRRRPDGSSRRRALLSAARLSFHSPLHLSRESLTQFPSSSPFPLLPLSPLPLPSFPLARPLHSFLSPWLQACAHCLGNDFHLHSDVHGEHRDRRGTVFEMPFLSPFPDHPPARE